MTVTDAAPVTLNLKAYGFDKFDLPTDFKPAELRQLGENLESIADMLDLRGDARKQLGRSMILKVGGSDGWAGSVGEMSLKDGQIQVAVARGEAGCLNTLAHELFHGLDARLYGDRYNGGKPAQGDRGETSAQLISAKAHALQGDKEGLLVVAAVGPLEHLKKQDEADHVALGGSRLGMKVERLFDKSLRGVSYFRRPQESMARSFAHLVSGQNVHTENDPNRSFPHHETESNLKKGHLASFAIAMAAVAKPALELDLTGKTKSEPPKLGLADALPSSMLSSLSVKPTTTPKKNSGPTLS